MERRGQRSSSSLHPPIWAEYHSESFGQFPCRGGGDDDDEVDSGGDVDIDGCDKSDDDNDVRDVDADCYYRDDYWLW